MAGAQAEIDALLAAVQAQPPGLLGGSAAGGAIAGGAGDGVRPPGATPEAGGAANSFADERVDRILQIKVPLMVVLAQRKMPVRDILNICIGSIIEFDKPADEELELLVNNRSIAFGHAVKIGENFGLRVVRIHDLRSRIDALRNQS